MIVRFFGSQIHYWPHMAPVANELSARGHEALVDQNHLRCFDRHDVAYAVAWSDISEARRLGYRRLVISEHGAGQSYSNRRRSYPGGAGRERLALVLAPNEQAAEAHRSFYPKRPPVVVVGSPWADDLVARYGGPPLDRDGDQLLVSHPPLVVASWHWRCGVSNESGTAWDDIGPQVMERLLAMRDSGEIRLAGSAHPRTEGATKKRPAVVDEVRDWCKAHEVEFIASFDEVCERSALLVIDNSSALYGFAALGRPVVQVDSPKWRLAANHGLRFWDERQIGPTIRDPQEVRVLVREALRDDDFRVQRRNESVERVWAHPGEAASRTVDALEQHFG